MSRRGAILQDYGGRFEPQPQDAQRDAAQYYQRDKEQANQMQQQKERDKQKQQGDATDFIGGLKADHVGDTTIDLYNDAQMKSLQDKLVAMQQKGAGVNEIKMAALPELQKIAQGYTIAKNEYGKIAEAQKNLMKDYPEGNAEAARNVMGKGLLENIYEYNPDGSIKGYKDPSLINSSKSYSDDLFDPEKMDAWYPNTINEVVANIQKTRGLTPLKGQLKLINPKGGYTDKKYEGHISIYDTPITDKDGKITGISLDAENVPLGKNKDGTANVIQVMPKGKYDVLRGNGKSAMQFDKAVYNHISKDLGINPKSLDPQAYDIYSRNYALEMLRTTGLQGSSYNQFDVEKENPIKNITNNYVNNGKQPVPVMDIVTPVKSYFETHKDAVIRYDSKDGKVKTISGVAPLNVFNNAVTDPIVETIKSRHSGEGLTANNIYYRNIDGTTWVMIARTPDDKKDGQFKINPEEDTPAFKLDEFTNVVGNKPGGIKPKNQALIDAQKKTKTEPIKTVKVKGL